MGGATKMKKKGYAKGGLKKAPNKGAASLPKEVRNKMGFMYGGGMTKKKKGYAKGGVVMCGASNPAERPMKKSK